MSFAENLPSKSNDYFSRLEIDGEDGSEFIDHWDTTELLFLASSVQRSDRNWVSVARGLKLYGENVRPSDFYTPKNCALQYTKLLNEVDEDSKKKTLPRTERETSEAMLVKNLTDKRLTELALLTQQIKSAANTMKVHMEMVENGELDDQLDDILKGMEEEEKREEENYLEYITKRESLIAAKKLNKSRLAKGKGSRAMDSKKKNSPYSDMSEDSPSKTNVAEVVKNIKKEIEEELAADSAKQHLKCKSEFDANISLNALLDSKVTMPASVSPTSPLLTSLLRTITSSSSVSPSLPPLSNSPLKESDHCEIEIAFPKSKETSPRGMVPQSPRPTPSSSPLLNSLLKNSPSSSTIASKDISPKAVSSPQPFFNPSNVLASAAAQQIAVATSAQSLSHQFFPQEAKQAFQSSPTTSACLSAPTLSKLLEMPPSTPGRLPPLPVLDSPVASTSAVSSSPIKTSIHLAQGDVKPNLSEFSPLKRIPDRGHLTSVVTTPMQVPMTPSPIKMEKDARKGDAKTMSSEPLDIKQFIENIKNDYFNESLRKEAELAAQANIEVVQEEIMDTTLDVVEHDFDALFGDDLKHDILTKSEAAQDIEAIKRDLLTNIKSEILEEITLPENIIKQEQFENVPVVDNISAEVQLFGTEERVNEDKVVLSSIKTDILQSPSLVNIPPTEIVKIFPTTAIKVEPDSPTKKTTAVKTTVPKSPVRSSLNVKVEEVEVKNLDVKIEPDNDTKSPLAKKQRTYEASPEKQTPSEDETISMVRRSGRKGKKSRGRAVKTPASQQSALETKDHYEFTESADESSASFPTSMLRYGTRIKETSKLDDKIKVIKQEPDDILQPDTTNQEKKSPMKGGKTSHTVDEDAVSESATSDDTSCAAPLEEKLLKSEESGEKQEIDVEMTPEISKNSQKAPKVAIDSTKKTGQKRSLSSSENPIRVKKNRKSSDSEYLLGECPKTMRETSKDKQTGDSEAIDDTESVQGFTAFPTVPATDHKEKKPTSHSGKQDWFEGVSPKSSEHVSQSSEESEYESDNWDNHSVSTNKSASHSSDPLPRAKRKERETPQYKAWKKAIHIVLREASCHKYANVFLQKVTNDVAPGYSGIVYRPMDLSLIKRNIDNGTIRTTEDFHRDLLLMFQNAIMYNSSDHDVYKMAVEMQRDVMQQVMAFLTTQYNDEDENSEPTSSLRGVRATKSLKGANKQTPTSAIKIKEEAD